MAWLVGLWVLFSLRVRSIRRDALRERGRLSMRRAPEWGRALRLVGSILRVRFSRWMRRALNYCRECESLSKCLAASQFPAYNSQLGGKLPAMDRIFPRQTIQIQKDRLGRLSRRCRADLHTENPIQPPSLQLTMLLGVPLVNL